MNQTLNNYTSPYQRVDWIVSQSIWVLYFSINAYLLFGLLLYIWRYIKLVHLAVIVYQLTQIVQSFIFTGPSLFCLNWMTARLLSISGWFLVVAENFVRIVRERVFFLRPLTIHNSHFSALLGHFSTLALVSPMSYNALW